MNRESFVRITCEVYQPVSDDIASALRQLGTSRFLVQNGRSIMLSERHPSPFSGRQHLIEDLVDVYRVRVPARHADAVMDRLIQSAMLHHEGRGSIYSENVEVIRREPTPDEDLGLEPGTHPPVKKLNNLMGIVCIVPRGQGNVIAQAALGLGLCVPTVFFGVGAGLRDRLGLIRITIPAEKELVNVITTAHDARGTVDALVEVGKLDQPGRGFVFLYPISHALLNTRLHAGRLLSTASLGQIVSAIDDLKGDAAWRQRFLSEHGRHPSRHRPSIRQLVDISILCREGFARDLARVAMDAGAHGATLTRLKQPVDGGEGPDSACSQAREVCTVVVPDSLAQSVIDAEIHAGALSRETGGEIILRPCPEVYTYVG